MSTIGHINWQTRAAMAYQWTRGQDIDGQQAELSRRIEGLIGRMIEQGQIAVDREECHATAAVDGIIFRLRRHNLVVLRPCSECGRGHVESPEIGSLPDLGYALTTWEAWCGRCPRAEPANWLERSALQG